MNERLLFNLALFFSISGIIILFLLAKTIEINDTTIDKIADTGTGNSVSVVGTVEEISEKGNITFIMISQTNEIKIVSFASGLDLKQGEQVRVTGKIQDYRNEKEIVADQILILR